MLEHRRNPLLPRQQFLVRQSRYAAFSLLILVFSIGLGMVGYHLLGRLPWIDAFLNAAMILTGMGPVDHLDTAGGKIFAAFYALFSGISFLTFVAILFTPIYHRFLHRFHLEIDDEGAER